MNLSLAKWIDRVFGRALAVLLAGGRLLREMVAPREALAG